MGECTCPTCGKPGGERVGDECRGCLRLRMVQRDQALADALDVIANDYRLGLRAARLNDAISRFNQYRSK